MNKIYILSSTYQAAVTFCRNQEPEINPRGKNVRIITRPEQTYGIRLEKRDVVHKIGTGDHPFPNALADAWKHVELTMRAEE